MTKVRNRQLRTRIAAAQTRLRDKLMCLDLESSEISEYNRRSLRRQVFGAHGILALYGWLLYLSLKDHSRSLQQLSLIDYGGGSGLLAFLAAQTGVGTVIYNDIYDISCKDVNYLSRLFDLPLNHTVCGDVHELVSYLHNHSLSADCVTSYDVLEHIYDVRDHFQKLRDLSRSYFRIVYASGANISNRRYVRSAMKLQTQAENEDRTRQPGHKSRDSLGAFLEIRRLVIAQYAPTLTPPEVELIARSTRGLIQRDIETCVDEYRRRGSITYRPDHPTNTCDPYTGNWCEHLIDFRRLQDTVTKAGFVGSIRPGFYHASRSPLKLALANTTLKVLGRWGMFAAPYYVVIATPARN